MNRTVLPGLVGLAILAGLTAGCSAGPSQPPGAQSHRGPAVGIGTPGHPLMLTCGQSSGPNITSPRHGDVVVGALFIINARDSVDQNGAGSTPQHGYKYPVAVRPGATVTMMIAPSARGHVVIDNPYGPAQGVVAATYQACKPSPEPGWTVFVQGFTFTDGRTRGCVPLTVRSGREDRLRNVTVSLYAGLCPAGVSR